MSKNELGVVSILFAVLDDRDTTQRPVVLDRDRTRRRVDVDLDRRDLFREQGVAVDGVDENFIEDFQKRWRVSHDALLEPRRVRVQEPILFGDERRRTDVRVGPFEHVLDVRQLLDGLVHRERYAMGAPRYSREIFLSMYSQKDFSSCMVTLVDIGGRMVRTPV